MLKYGARRSGYASYWSTTRPSHVRSNHGRNRQHNASEKFSGHMKRTAFINAEATAGRVRMDRGMKKRARYRAAQAVHMEVDLLVDLLRPCPPKASSHTWQARLGRWHKMNRLRSQSLYAATVMPLYADNEYDYAQVDLDTPVSWNEDWRGTRKRGEYFDDGQLFDYEGWYDDEDRYDCGNYADYDDGDPFENRTPDASEPAWVDLWLHGVVDTDYCHDDHSNYDFFEHEDDGHDLYGDYDGAWLNADWINQPDMTGDHFSSDVERNVERLKAGERYYRQHKRVVENPTPQLRSANEMATARWAKRFNAIHGL